MRLGQPSRRLRSSTMTPLIDVVFILLVFFLLATSFLPWRGIELASDASPGRDRANPSTAPVARAPGVLLRLFGDGRVDLNGRILKAAGGSGIDRALARSLAPLLEKSPGRRLVIQVDEGVSTQRLVQVLDAVDVAGGAVVTLRRR